MKIIVASNDRTAELGPELEALAQACQVLPTERKPATLSTEISALALTGTQNETEFLDQYMRIMRKHDGMDARPFHIPRRTGLFGMLLGRVRAFLWKCQQYQFARIAFRQNLVNSLFTDTFEFQRDEYRRENAVLRKRLAALEARLVTNNPESGTGANPNTK